MAEITVHCCFIFSPFPETVEESNVEPGFEVYIKSEMDCISEMDHTGLESKVVEEEVGNTDNSSRWIFHLNNRQIN